MNSTLKLLIFVAVVVGGVHYGWSYLRSNDFQVYADQTQAPWTCYVDLVFGQVHYIREDYDKAMMRFSHAIKRCPGTEAAERADFETARCYEGKKDNRSAWTAYVAFREKYPSSPRAKIADRAAEILHGS